jgi:Ser/Thr protein kinase RdoA (MazF antagonist)
VVFEGRLVEAEAYVDHDAVMDSWRRLEAGMALLAQVHNRLRDLEVAELVTQAEAGLVSGLARQPVHGDFWDNNVGFRGGRPVLVADFDFMGERARIDDLTLTLHCARCDLGAEAGLVQELAWCRSLPGWAA